MSPARSSSCCWARSSRARRGSIEKEDDADDPNAAIAVWDVWMGFCRARRDAGYNCRYDWVSWYHMVRRSGVGELGFISDESEVRNVEARKRSRREKEGREALRPPACAESRQKRTGLRLACFRLYVWPEQAERPVSSSMADTAPDVAARTVVSVPISSDPIDVSDAPAAALDISGLALEAATSTDSTSTDPALAPSVGSKLSATLTGAVKTLTGAVSEKFSPPLEVHRAVGWLPGLSEFNWPGRATGGDAAATAPALSADDVVLQESEALLALLRSGAEPSPPSSGCASPLPSRRPAAAAAGAEAAAPAPPQLEEPPNAAAAEQYARLEACVGGEPEVLRRELATLVSDASLPLGEALYRFAIDFRREHGRATSDDSAGLVGDLTPSPTAPHEGVAAATTAANPASRAAPAQTSGLGRCGCLVRGRGRG